MTHCTVKVVLKTQIKLSMQLDQRNPSLHTEWNLQ